MSHETQAKLVALKSHYLGREADLRKTVASTRAIASSCLAQLAQQEANLTVVRRSTFYALIIAELDRDGSADFRKRAADYGRQMFELGGENPFPLYMKIVNATTRKMNSGNFGDLRTRAAAPIVTSEKREHRKWNRKGEGWMIYTKTLDFAAIAVDLTKDEIKKHYRFLWEEDLEHIVRTHGLTPKSLDGSEQVG